MTISRSFIKKYFDKIEANDEFVVAINASPDVVEDIEDEFGEEFEVPKRLKCDGILDGAQVFNVDSLLVRSIVFIGSMGSIILVSLNDDPPEVETNRQFFEFEKAID